MQAILQGGIPTTELFEPYVQQQKIAGFDIMRVLEPKNADYYVFKPEFVSKKVVRDTLANESNSVIEQFIYWWEKYHISLAEMNEQVRAAEMVMQGHLQELGYV